MLAFFSVHNKAMVINSFNAATTVVWLYPKEITMHTYVGQEITRKFNKNHVTSMSRPTELHPQKRQPHQSNYPCLKPLKTIPNQGMRNKNVTKQCVSSFEVLLCNSIHAVLVCSLVSWAIITFGRKRVIRRKGNLSTFALASS